MMSSSDIADDTLGMGDTMTFTRLLCHTFTSEHECLGISAPLLNLSIIQLDLGYPATSCPELSLLSSHDLTVKTVYFSFIAT